MSTMGGRTHALYIEHGAIEAAIENTSFTFKKAHSEALIFPFNGKYMYIFLFIIIIFFKSQVTVLNCIWVDSFSFSLPLSFFTVRREIRFKAL